MRSKQPIDQRNFFYFYKWQVILFAPPQMAFIALRSLGSYVDDRTGAKEPFCGSPTLSFSAHSCSDCSKAEAMLCSEL